MVIMILGLITVFRDESVLSQPASDRDVDQGLLLQWAFGRKA